jgi:hypothetical protein
MIEIIIKLLNLSKSTLLPLVIMLGMFGCSGKNDAFPLPTLRNSPSGEVTFLGQSDDFVFFVDMCIQDEEIIDQVKRLIKPIQRVYEQVSNGLKANIIGEDKTAIVFACQEATLCSLNGQASWDKAQSKITIFFYKGISEEQILYVSAHEMAHLIQWEYLGEGTVDPILVEGWATLAAEPYLIEWLDIQSIDQQVQTYISENQYVGITKPGLWDQMYTNTGCLGVRQTMYIEWASFVGYIINNYGVENLMELMSISFSLTNSARNPGQSIGTGEYEAVFGKTLQELERDWLSLLLTD